jgi:hypothetical protein
MKQKLFLTRKAVSGVLYPYNSDKSNAQKLEIIIIIIGTTAHFEPRPSSEASASCPYSLQHSSSFSPPTS